MGRPPFYQQQQMYRYPGAPMDGGGYPYGGSPRDPYGGPHRDPYGGPPRDPYAGLLTRSEQDWLIRIQMLQLHTDDPYTDDYYYTVSARYLVSTLPFIKYLL